MHTLRIAQERGYTHEELAELISSERGIRITAGTLRKYMAQAKKDRGAVSAEPSIPPTSPVSTLSNAPKFAATLSPDRQESLTRRKPVSSDDDIESQFSNLN